MVVLHHVIHAAGYKDTEIFASGVDLFFVISGFIMVYTTRASAPTMMDFLRNRATRVIPMYWLVTIATVFAVLAGLPFFGHHEIQASYLLKSLLFLPEFDGNGVDLMPIVLVGWTLNFEMFFYVCFSLTLVCGRNLAHRGLLVVPIFAALTAAAVVSGDKVLGYYANNVIWEFVFGILIAYSLPAMTISKTRDAKIGAWLLIASSVVWLLVAAQHSPMEARSMAFGLPAAGIVVAALVLERNDSKVTSPLLLLLGAASYSIYLLHVFVLQIISKIMDVTQMNQSSIGLGVGYMAMIVASAVAGIISYRLLEKPITAALQRRRLAPTEKAARHPRNQNAFAPAARSKV